ncbi:alpha/beta hydrolase family protein [Arsenicitalea aurantiaca]|uniref:alpha/beta hydrolase family protein n=1 Tax=Arsenicitalea aurantiaca TaxID=1783274 RepID=UPI0013153A25|nr:peptidase [Arsenicitalea aurantiaca]
METDVGARDLFTIPYVEAGVAMRAQLFRPAGAGPFRLALIAHGSAQSPAARAQADFPQFPALAAWLNRRGYAVLIAERPGHGRAGGPYREDQGPCLSPDYLGSARATAGAIAAALAFGLDLEGISNAPALVIGNSAGGWGALALAGDRARIGAIIGIAAGRGGRNLGRAENNCAPDRLVAAAGALGTGAGVPTLLLYAENDSYFAPALARELAAAYRGAGADAEFVLLPPIKGDGHALALAPEAVWAGALDAFLARNGL